MKRPRAPAHGRAQKGAMASAIHAPGWARCHARLGDNDGHYPSLLSGIRLTYSADYPSTRRRAVQSSERLLRIRQFRGRRLYADALAAPQHLEHERLAQHLAAPGTPQIHGG